MLTLRRPTDEALAALVERMRTVPYNYETGLLRREATLRRWFIDRHREVIGHGEADFAAACDAMRDWDMFREPWTRPAIPLAALRAGETVGYSARQLGVWWSYCCRIIAVIDEQDADGTRRFGFDYGTLRAHAERGEERFLVKLDGTTGEVTYELFAISRPGRWFIWIGLPLARRAQAQFRPGSSAAMRAFVVRARDASR
ncbi:unnamed protein product [Phaeothamnion confervicola]